MTQPIDIPAIRAEAEKIALAGPMAKEFKDARSLLAWLYTFHERIKSLCNEVERLRSEVEERK